MPEHCGEPITSRSKYEGLQQRTCQGMKGHAGRHSEFPFLDQLKKSHPRVFAKIVRDSIMTTGASWKSADAGPNRILRWVMLRSDEELKGFGIDMTRLKPQVIAKLRDKAADYESCMDVARRLTWLAYQMPDAPKVDEETKVYLEGHFGQIHFGSGTCMVCRSPLSFELFDKAVRGKAVIETSHSNPRSHSETNVGFAHRECNIAQGNMSLEQFYEWIDGILRRVRG